MTTLSTLPFHYGDGDAVHDRAAMLHTDCTDDGEIWYIDDGWICTGCHEQWDDDGND